MAETPPQKNWGISLLSKSKYPRAYREEVMINKLTGEVLVKTPEGDVVSYGYLSRYQAHISEATNAAYAMNIYGPMYRVELTGVTYPDVVSLDTNLIEDEPIVIASSYRKFMLSIDVDVIKIEDNELVNPGIDPTVAISYSVKKNGSYGTEEIYLSTVSELNKHIFELGSDPIEELSIINITLGIDSSVDSTVRAILSNMILVVEE